MNARAEQHRVVVSLTHDDPEVFERLAGELIDATTETEALESRGGPAYRSARERLTHAEYEFDDAFTETLSIEQAEALHRALGRAIRSARLNRGDWQYRDTDEF